jgi:hypothetical protein
MGTNLARAIMLDRAHSRRDVELHGYRNAAAP